MATLPEGITLQTGLTMQRQPSLSWKINKTTNRIERETDGFDEVRQAVEIILNTERFRWAIYQPYSGVEWEGLIGRDPGYVAANLLRRVTEALRVDDRIRGVTDFSYEIEGEHLTARMTVNTVYGDTPTRVEVNLA